MPVNSESDDLRGSSTASGSQIKQENAGSPRGLRAVAELVAVLYAYSTRVLRMPPKDAAADTRLRVEALAHFMGGRQQYLPGGCGLYKEMKNNLIYQMSQTHKASEIADLFEMNEIRVYAIIREARAREASRPRNPGGG